MIIVKLAGGLGNQMFQYAAGRSLAQQWQTELKLDLGYFASQQLRTYSLGGFNTQQVLASPTDIERVHGTAGSTAHRWWFQLRQYLLPVHRRTLVRERMYLRYDPAPFVLARDLYLEGYWQNARYFAPIATLLRDEFTPACEVLPTNLDLVQQIDRAIAIGVHVRRGDYVADARTHQVHGVCTVAYYEQCAQKLLREIPAAHFFIFTDDPGWVSANLQLGGTTTIVTPSQADRDYEQLLLLSRCRHFILANSTFSWWAAWLGQRADQLVFAPKAWFAADQYDTSDFIPGSWIRR